MPLDNLSRPTTGLLGDFANGIDQRKQQVGRLVMGLLSNPDDTIAMLRAGDAEAHQRNLRTPAMDGSSRSVMPEIAQQGREAAMNVALNVGGLLGITAYHGSPHLFDKFDPTKAGKSGGTSFGLGHNLSESPAHASAYKGEGGNLYKVDISDDALPSLLQWESKTPKAIAKEVPPLPKDGVYPFGGGATVEKTERGWVLNAGNGVSFPMQAKEVDRMFGSGGTGEQTYRRLVAALGDEAKASEWLRQRGVKGIKNNTERGVPNYVVFPGEEKILSVLGRE